MSSDLESPRSNSIATMGKRLVAYVVLIAVGLLALKLVIGAVIGVVFAIGSVALVIALVLGVIWALRRI